MGEDALDTDEELEIETEETEEPEAKDGDNTLEAEDSEEEAEEVEFEVVREIVEGSQPVAKQPTGFTKRVNKLNARNAAKDEVISEAGTKNAQLENEIKLLKMSLEQKQEAEELKAPNPDDFDDGVYGDKFNTAQSDYTKKVIAEEVKKATASIPTATADQNLPDSNLVKMQTKHYEKAEELGAKNYEDIEDNAIGILGNEIANFIISSSDNSPAILYYLGTKKNQAEAEQLLELTKTNPGRAVMQIGRLEAEIRIPSRAKKKPGPNPDEELTGGSSSGSTRRRGPTFE